MTGTVPLLRLAIRRDRVVLPACVYGIVVLVASTAYTFKKLYPTPAARASLLASGGGNPALRFLYGRLWSDSLGSLTAWRYGMWAAIFASLMAVFLVVRHTRADEESGRLELVGSAAVGRQAALVSGLSVAVIANLLIAVLLCVALPFTGLHARGLPAAGSALLGLAIGCCGLAFTGIAGVCAQLSSSARTARGIALGVLGVSFVLRGAGDAAAGPGSSGLAWLSWVSPLGWIQFARPFARERWWVLCLPLLVFVLCVGLAFALAARRDLGAGLLADRPGRPVASSFLRGPGGLAWRLQRASLFWWAVGYAFTFAASGAAAKGIGSLFGGSKQLRDEFSKLGGQADIVPAYLAALMLLAGLVAAAYAIAAVLRLRVEETSGRAEPVLACAVARARWALSYVVEAVLGAVVLLLVAGIATGLGYGVRTGSAGHQVWHLMGAGLAQAPAVLVLMSVALLLFGARGSWSVPGAWSVLGLVVLLALFGQDLKLPGWLMDISPFTHAPRVPGGVVSAAPMLWLAAVAVVLCASGLVAFRQRDLG
jgi:ABC-2 type transport system permease protein